MSVYIKGMEMPKNCGECKFFAWKQGVGNHCSIDESITFHATLDGLDVRYEKNGNCPFVELPPHGDLIDRDVLEVHDGWMNEYREKNVQQTHITFVYSNDIANAPTIIEAEPEVHDCENCKWFGGLMCDHVDENYKCLGWEAEEVYAQGYDTAGNYHWTGTKSGEHIIGVRGNSDE